MATILDPPITEDLLFYLNLYYNLSSEFGVSLSNGTQGSSSFPFLALASWHTADAAHHSLFWSSLYEVTAAPWAVLQRERRRNFWRSLVGYFPLPPPTPTSWSKTLKVSFQSNILYYLSILVWRKQETDFLLNMIICPLMSSYFSCPSPSPLSFQNQYFTPITITMNLVEFTTEIPRAEIFPLEIFPKWGKLLLPSVSPVIQLLGLLLLFSPGTLLLSYFYRRQNEEPK